MTQLYSTIHELVSYPYRALTSSDGRTVAEDLDIHWIVPHFGPGAGGITTIMRFVQGFSKMGHRCTVWVNILPVHDADEDVDYKGIIENHYFPVDASFLVLPKDHNQICKIAGDILIATDRYTCFPARAMSNFIRRFYFVQDQEEMFYPVGSEYFLTESTYKFGFDCLCAGKWLANSMRTKYGAWAYSWDLAVDHSKYFPSDHNGSAHLIPRIACYARHVTSRRCVELMLVALDIAASKGIEFEVDFFGWPLNLSKVQYSFVDHGIISENGLADIYRGATIGIVFSATNYSLIPKEMMACGLPVIELSTESIRQEFDQDCIEMCPPDPVSIAKSICELLCNTKKRSGLSAKGILAVKDSSWDDSVRNTEKAIKSRIASL